MVQKAKSSLNKKRKMVILARDGFRCQYCGITRADGAVLEVDHKVPLSRGGSDRVANLITACRDCNRSKRDKPLPVPPLKAPERFILNADGSITNVLPKGFCARDVARADMSVSRECIHCGKPARNRVVWKSPHLVGRENKSRSFVYALCEACTEGLFTKQDASIGNAIDEILIPMAEAAGHVRLVESFDISRGGDK